MYLHSLYPGHSHIFNVTWYGLIWVVHTYTIVIIICLEAAPDTGRVYRYTFNDILKFWAEFHNTCTLCISQVLPMLVIIIILDLSKTLTILHDIIRYAIQGGIELVFAYHSHHVAATKFAFMLLSQDTKRTTQVTAPY